MPDPANDLREMIRMIQRSRDLVANDQFEEARVMIEDAIIRAEQHKELWPQAAAYIDIGLSMLNEAKSIIEARWPTKH